METENDLILQEQQQYKHYCDEAGAIKKKLDNEAVPEGKKAKLRYRLRDIETRLIPQVVSRMAAPMSATRK